MPSKVTRAGFIGRKWDAPGPYPDGSLGSPVDCSITYSSDLYESTNNMSSLRAGQLGSGKDVGGNFLVVKRTYSEDSTLGTGIRHFNPYHLYPTATSSGRPHYAVAQRAWSERVHNGSFPVVSPSPGNQMNAWATTAIARMNPRKPVVNLAQFVGELREGLPRAILIRDTAKERLAKTRNAGDEYLNVEFGWKPLLRDISAFYDTYRRSHELLARMEKESGVQLRRRYDFPDEVSSVEQDMGFRTPQPNLPTACYGTSAAGRVTRTTFNITKKWCVASFLSYFPAQDNVQGRLDAWDRLYGVKPTPQTLWELAPWSWAADWVGNMGDIVSNLSYLGDTTAMPYCYMMEHKTTRVEYFNRGFGNQYKAYPGFHWFTQSFQTETKQRVRGTPYGFGLNWSGFSQKQLAILAALGISRT